MSEPCNCHHERMVHMPQCMIVDCPCEKYDPIPYVFDQTLSTKDHDDKYDKWRESMLVHTDILAEYCSRLRSALEADEVDSARRTLIRLRNRAVLLKEGFEKRQGDEDDSE